MGRWKRKERTHASVLTHPLLEHPQQKQPRWDTWARLKNLQLGVRWAHWRAVWEQQQQWQV